MSTKISELTEDTSPSSDDYLLTTDNASGQSRKATIANVVAAAGGGGGSGSGDASTNTSTSVDGEAVLFSGTGGKTLKRATITGLGKFTSGVLSAATSGTDYAPATSGTSILKGNGSGGFSAASAGTDYYNPGGTDVAVADGGTGASTASGARTNLGLVIGTDVQAYDAELAALAGLTSAADKLPYFTGSGTASLADFTAAGRALVDDADATAQRTTLGLGTIATQAASNVSITGGSITGITDLAVADGGTGASNASGARTNLGLVIGTDVQAFSSTLSTWAGKAPPSGTVVGTSDTQTLTNKRVTSRIGSTASSSTPTPDADSHDQYNVTALAAGATFGAPTGTPTDGQKLIIRIKDNGTARPLAFNAIYRFVGTTAPTTTVVSKTLYLGTAYNAADTKWDVIATAQEA